MEEQIKEALSNIKASLKAALADDELANLAAQSYYNFYQKLRLAGFNTEEALQIVAGQGLGFK